MSRIEIDVRGDDVERIAFAHGTNVEANDTHKFTTYAGITYRAELAAVES